MVHLTISVISKLHGTLIRYYYSLTSNCLKIATDIVIQNGTAGPTLNRNKKIIQLVPHDQSIIKFYVVQSN